MTNQNDSNAPSSHAEQHPPSQPEILTSTPEQSKVGTQTDKRTNEQQTVAQEMRREFRWFEYGSLFINCALAVIGVIALCIYHGQLGVMSGQFTEMQEARKQAKLDNFNAISAQQKIAQDSLAKSQEIFDKSSRKAENTFREEQRAWLSGHTDVAPMDIDKPVPDPFNLIIFNSGKTFARKVEMTAHSVFVPSILHAFPPVGAEPVDRSVAVIAPNSPSVNRIFPIDRDQGHKLKDVFPEAAITNDWYLYVWGDIAYEDVFHPPGKHTTKFCFYRILSKAGLQLIQCEMNNNAD
jgi:hypothetical protein